MDVIWDIDGTLANNDHRAHLVEQEKPDWDAFLSEEVVSRDEAIPATWHLLTMMVRQPDRIIFITGRPER